MWDWLLHKLHIVSGSKLVTQIGSGLFLAGEFCKTLGEDWIATHAHWLMGFCTLVVIGGAAMAIVGKGLFDRRVDEERGGGPNVGGLEPS